MDKLEALEKEVQEVKATLETLVSSVNDLAQSVSKMNAGLYDDDANGHVGIITKYRELAKEVEVLKKNIADINQKNADQDIAIKAKRGLGKMMLEVLRWAGFGYLLVRGGADLKDFIIK